MSPAGKDWLSNNFSVSRASTPGRACFFKFASATGKNYSYSESVSCRALFPSTHNLSQSSFMEQLTYFVISTSAASEVSSLSLCAILSISVCQWTSWMTCNRKPLAEFRPLRGLSQTDFPFHFNHISLLHYSCNNLDHLVLQLTLRYP